MCSSGLVNSLASLCGSQAGYLESLNVLFSRARRAATGRTPPLVDRWIHDIGLDTGAYGTHTMRRTKASCACKYGKHQLFGDLEMSQVAWSIGRDIVLSPAQQGQPLLFFAGPYAELDDLPLPPLDRHVRFNEI